MARCEQSIMLGFYSVRKLIQSAKLTLDVSRSGVQVQCYRATGRTIHLLNNHGLEDLYDLETPSKRTISVGDLCNQIIHSYVFSIIRSEEGGLFGFVVASDRDRNKELIEVPVSTAIGLFERVAADDITSMSLVFDTKKEDYVVKAARNTARSES